MTKQELILDLHAASAVLAALGIALAALQGSFPSTSKFGLYLASASGIVYGLTKAIDHLIDRFTAPNPPVDPPNVPGA